MVLYGADNNNTVNMTDRSERDRETVGVVILNTKTHAAKKKEMKQKTALTTAVSSVKSVRVTIFPFYA